MLLERIFFLGDGVRSSLLGDLSALRVPDIGPCTGRCMASPPQLVRIRRNHKWGDAYLPFFRKLARSGANDEVTTEPIVGVLGTDGVI